MEGGGGWREVEDGGRWRMEGGGGRREVEDGGRWRMEGGGGWREVKRMESVVKKRQEAEEG